MSRDHFESIATIPSPLENFDEVYVVIDRTNGRMIERMSLRLGGINCNNDDPRLIDQIFMDSAVEFSLQGGLDHLEGKEVVILADGEVIEGRTIVNGDFDPPLGHSYSTAYVGLRYISDLGILQPEID